VPQAYLKLRFCLPLKKVPNISNTSAVVLSEHITPPNNPMVQSDIITQTVASILGQSVLQKAWIKDQVANGVQISGSESVDKIALGVSLNLEFLNHAVKWGAQYCIVHHGLDPRTHVSKLPTYLQKELKLIFNHNLTISGYHFALDAHPVIGNNAQIIQKLNASVTDQLFDEWGFVGRFTKSQSINNIKLTCQKLFDHPIEHYVGGNQTITTIGVVSGAAKPYAAQIADFEAKGIQLYISGETSESTPHKLVESGIDYFVCGHYATETFGIKALGEKLKESFKTKVEIKFIDVPSSI
jgi:dinuclear metal center YbgI/SA1388 family protein